LSHRHRPSRYCCLGAPDQASPCRHAAPPAYSIDSTSPTTTARVPAGEDGIVESLAELRVQRTLQCRLAPDRALRSLEEAEAFLRDRGLLTRTADCALPSLYEACHEDPYKPGSAGFATWPATK